MRINLTIASLADARRLCAAVESCGATAPEKLSVVLRVAETFAAVPTVADPTRELVKAALDGNASADKVDKMLERHALMRIVAEERRGLTQRIEPQLLAEFGRRLDDGGGDEVLAALRPQFTDAALCLREALDIVDIAIDPAEFLQTASSEQLSAFQRIGPCVALLDRISAIVSVFGPAGGSFPLVPDPRATDPSLGCGWLHNVAVMCCSGDLLQSCAAFQKPRPVGDVRSSPWLRTVPYLHSVESARERLRSRCESAWAAEESGRRRSGRLIDNLIIDDPPRRNPFAL